MSVIALNNRIKSDSDAVFASCAALPIHQKTLNSKEMAGIDGLWDWDEFNESVQEQAIKGTIVGAATGATVGAMGGGVGAFPGGLTGAGVGYVGGVITGAVDYIWSEITSEDSDPQGCTCSCN